jgi:hypothetical protein
MRKPVVRRYVAAICLLLVAVAGVFWFRTPASSFPPIPQPNGYDALTRASANLRRLPGSVNQLSTEQLAEAMANNRAALEELGRSMLLPGVVPVQMSETWFTVHTPELMSLKTAAVVLDAEAELKSRMGDTSGALLAALDGLRLGEAVQRGGVLIDFLVGSACEVIAVRRMTNRMADLGMQECKRAVQALQEYETRRESIDAIQRREKEWSRRTFSIFKRITVMIQFRSLRPDNDPGSLAPDVVKDYNARTREARLALLRLAAHAYTLERGTPPARPADLVPAYLQQLPLDPATGKPLDLP